MSFSILFFPKDEEGLKAHFKYDITLNFEINGEVIKTLCSGREAVFSAIYLLAFCSASCEGIKELEMRSGLCTTFLSDVEQCQSAKGKLVTDFGSIEPSVVFAFTKKSDKVRIEVLVDYEIEYYKTFEVSLSEVAKSVLEFLESVVSIVGDDKLRRSLEIAKDIATREGLIAPSAEEGFKITVDWVGEFKCGSKRMPLLYSGVRARRVLFSGIVDPLSFASELINLALLTEESREETSTPVPLAYRDWFREALALIGTVGKKKPAMILTLGSFDPRPIFVFRDSGELLLVSPSRKTVARVPAKDIVPAVSSAVLDVVDWLKKWDDTEYPGYISKEKAISMITEELGRIKQKKPAGGRE